MSEITSHFSGSDKTAMKLRDAAPVETRDKSSCDYPVEVHCVPKKVVHQEHSDKFVNS